MPMIPSPPSVERSADTPPDASLLAEILGVAGAVRRRWAWVALATAAALAAAVLFLMAVTPRYLATAQLLIDPRAKRIVEGAVVPGGFGSSAAGADTLLVDSQVELIQSNSVLKKIVESERLHEDAEFAVPRSGGGIRILLRNTIGRVLFGNERESPPATDPVDTAVWRFADKHLRVRRPGNTYVINVSVMSQDPAKAARLANAVANAYINDQVRATGDTTRDATAALESRIEDLRKRVETAESAVEAFRTQAGLIGGPNLLVTEQQLQQTNDKLILARSQTALAKARYDQVSGLSARAGSAVLAAQSDALKSPVIANLRASLSRVERREAIAQQSLRPGHPEYANVLVEKRAILAQIDEELARIKANARSELELAQSNEQALAGELKSLETRTATGNQAQVRLRELQREAQAARAIFEQFLNRAKETSEQETLGRENSRIISAATVPPYPAFPPTLLILAGALLAGLVAGIGTAWLAHLLSGPADAAAAAVPASAPPTPPAPEPPSAAPRRRLRKLLAPLARPKPMNPPPRVPTADIANAAPIIATTVPGDGGTAVIETLARLPAIGKYPPARPGAGIADGPTFSDHIAAVDDASATAYPGYREVIDQILAKLQRAGAAAGKPTICLLVGTEAAAGTSSTALALTYRSAIKGRRTLLIDACASDPHLSQVFAANLKQRRACVLDSEAHLAEITLQDARTGLSMLPIALADLARFDGEQQRRLLAGLRQLTQRFELVIIDAGAAADNQAMAFLAAIADRVLIVTQQSSASSGLSRLRAMEAARRFPARGAASIVETAAA